MLPAGTNTSNGATAPALAGAATFSARITSRALLRSAFVKMKPTLPRTVRNKPNGSYNVDIGVPLTCGSNRSYSGKSEMKPLIALRTCPLLRQSSSYATVKPNEVTYHSL